MALSLADICNQALQCLGTRTTVTAGELAAGSSNEAIQFNIIQDSSRTDLLRMAPWGCAVSTENLVMISAAPGTPENPTPIPNQWQPGTPPPPWLYEYTYPDDCIRALGIIPPLSAQSWALDSFKFEVRWDKGLSKRVIVCNQPLATMRYIANVTDPNQMDTLLETAWVNVIAAQLALALTGDKGLANARYQQANRMIEQARAYDGQESLDVLDSTPDWLAIRGFNSDQQLQSALNFIEWGPLWPTV